MDTFGRYLSQQRELRGMSRNDVIGVTKLSPSAVSALEEDRYDAIPARVFVIGYIRAYAGCIGLNPDEAVLRYDEYSLKARGPSGVVATPGAASVDRGNPLRWLILVVVFVLLAALVAYLFLFAGLER